MAARGFGLLTALVAACTAVPVAAQGVDPGNYRYCRVTGTVGGQPWSLVRTFKRGGEFAFQSGLGGQLLPNPEHDLRAHLVWPRSPSDAARLWIVQHYRMTPYARLVFGAKGEAGVPLGTVRLKNGAQFFEVDPAALLQAFPGRHALPFVLLRADKTGHGKHGPLRSVIDLDALRAQLRQAASLGGAIVDSGCAGAAPDLPPEIDIAQYVLCDVEHDDATGHYDYGSDSGPRWNYRISAFLFFGAGSPEMGLYTLRDREHLFVGPHQLRLFRYDNVPRYKGAETIEFSAGARRYAVALGDAWRMDWSRVIEVERAGGGIEVFARNRRGVVVDHGTLLPGFFSAVQAQLQAIIDRRIEVMRDPIANCAPQMPSEADAWVIT